MPLVELPNDSFETNTTGWASNGAGVTIERVADGTAPDGSFSLKVNVGGGGWEGIGGVRSNSVDVAAGGTHSYELMAKVPIGRTIFPAISERNSGDSQLAFKENVVGIAGTGEWMKVGHEATFGGSGVKLRAFLRVDGAGAAAFWVDSVAEGGIVVPRRLLLLGVGR